MNVMILTTSSRHLRNVVVPHAGRTGAALRARRVGPVRRRAAGRPLAARGRPERHWQAARPRRRDTPGLRRPAPAPGVERHRSRDAAVRRRRINPHSGAHGRAALHHGDPTDR